VRTPTKSKTPTRTNTQPTYTLTPTQTPTQTPSITLTPIDLSGYQYPIWRFYYYAGDTRIAMRLVNGTTDLVFFLFTDQLGSTNVTSDQNGLMVSLSRYKPWGESNDGTGTRPTDYGFTGQRSMDYIGLDWYGSRWYDSSLGRWNQPDTDVPESQGVQSWNRYAYVNNSPLKNTDPTGHMSCEECVEGGEQEIPLVDPIGPVNEAAGASEVVDVVPESPGGPVETYDTLESSPDLNSGENLPEQLTNDSEHTEDENNSPENGENNPESKNSNIRQPKRGDLRKNMQKAGIDKPSDMTKPQAHHLFPWKFMSWFSERGININEPQNGEWVEGSPEGSHQEWTSDYNNAWKDYINDHPNATQQQIEDYMNALNDSGNYPSR
jgi:RHS repeat-associated protein